MSFKRLFSALMLTAMLCIPWVGSAQSLAEYVYSTGVDNTQWLTVSSTTNLVGSGDGVASTLQSIGFSFPFAEDTYTQFSVNSDGNLRLGSTVTGTTLYTTPFSSSYANSNNPKINFFGCDGYTTTGHYIYSELQGTAPNRVRVVEFCIGTYTTATRNELYKFQVQLYESGDIKVVYGVAPTTAPNVARQEGMCVNSADVVLVDASHVATSYSAGSTNNIATGTWPSEGRYYSFVRPVITCPRVSTIVADLADDEATYSWTENGTATSWAWEMRQGTTLVSSGVESTTSVTVTGLTAQTSYTFSVRPICGVGDTGAARTVTATTACAPVAHTDLPFFDGFETYSTGTTAQLSPCYYKWYNGTQVTTSYPYPSATTPATGTKCLYMYSSNTSGYYSYFTLPLFEDDLADLQVSFKARKSSTSYAGRIQMGVMNNPQDFSTFTPVADITLPSASTSWESFTTYLSSYTGTGRYIAFVCPQTTTTNYMYLDDVEVAELPACPIVSNLSVSLDGFDATASWHENGTATSWLCELYSGSTLLGSMEVYDTTATVYGLDPQTTYTVSVRPLCSNGDTAQAVTAEFTTPCVAVAHEDLPFFDGFESYSTGTTAELSPCYYKWYNGTHVTNSYPYPSATTPAHGGKCLYMYGSSTAGYYSYFTLPLFDDSLADLQLSFNLRKSSTSYAGNFQVGVMTDPTDMSTFTLVENIVLPAGSTEWNFYTVYFDQYTGYGRYIALLDPQASTTNYLYLDDVEVDERSACPGVSNLAVTVSGGDATATWHENGTAASWNLVLVPNGAAVDDDDAIVATAYDTTYTFMSVAANTNYDLYVMPDCGGDEADTMMVTFFSYCATISSADLPYIEDFETYGTGSAQPISPCWTKGTTSTTAYPYPYTTAAINGNRGLYFYGYYPSSATTTPVYSYAALPSIDVTDLDITDLAVSFNMKRYTTTTSYYSSKIVVGVMSNPSDITTFDTVQIFDLTAEPASTVQHQLCSFANYTGSGTYVAFYSPIPELVGTNTYGYNYVYIDDIALDLAPSCDRPEDLTALYVGRDTVILSWSNSGAGSYLVDNGTSQMTVADTVCVFTGLNPESPYTFTVRAICDGGATSDFNSVSVFTACGSDYVTIPWHQNFDTMTTSTTAATGYFPPCWDFVLTGSSTYQASSYNPTVYYSATNANSGSYSLRLYGVGYHMLPAVSEPLNTLQISLSNYSTSSSYALELVAVEDTGYTVLGNLTPSATSTHETFTLYLNNYQGTSRRLALHNTYPSSTTIGYSYHYIDDITIDYLPTCFPVDSLQVTAMTATTADLHWASPASEFQVKVQHGNSVVYQNTAYTTDEHVTGLSASTDYTAYVRPICSAGDTAGWSHITFVTPCASVAVPWSENFDNMTTSTTAATGVQPTCWSWDMLGGPTYSTTTYQPQVYYSTTYPHSGNYCFRLYGISVTALPTFDMEVDSLQLSFYARHISASYILEIGALEGTTFVPIDTVDFVSTSSTDQYTFYLNNYQGTSHTIAFRNTYAGGTQNYSYVYLDDIQVSRIPTCVPVDNLHVTAVTTTSANLAWNHDATEYEVEYGVAGHTLGQGTTVTVNAPSVALSGLTDDTQYDVYVRAICGVGDTSLWQTKSFYTDCNAITALPWSENFDGLTTSTTAATGVQPNCWRYEMTGSNTTAAYLPQVYYSTTYPHSGNYCLRLYGLANTSLPTFAASLDSLQISFYARHTSDAYMLEVGAMEGTTFVPIDTVQFTNTTSTDLYTIYLSSYQGPSHTIAFRNSHPTYAYSYVYVDDIVVDYIPSCPPVTHVEAATVSTSEISVDWTDVASCGSWQIEYGVAGFTQGQGTTVTVSSHPALISGLQPSTNYQFYVRPVCSSSDFGPWSLPASGHTECSTISAPYHETFDYTNASAYNTAGELPGCWEGYTNGTSDLYVPHVVGSGSYWYADSAHAMVMTSGSTATYGNTKLVRLPLFSQAVNTLSMSFWMSTESQTNGTLSVGYFTTGDVDTLSFVSIKDIPASAATYHGTGSGESAQGLRDTVSFDSVPATAVAIGFRWYFNSTFYSVCIDDVEVTSSNSCVAPMVAPGAVTYEQANVSWTGSAESYNVSIREVTSSNWADEVTVQGNAHTFTSLAPSTTYQVRVSAICDTDMMSPYGYAEFTTDELPCFAPTAVEAAPAFTSASINWTPGSSEQFWSVRVFNTAFDTTLLAQAHPFVVTGLVMNTTYNVTVQALCGSNGNIPSETWSDTVTFTTSECDAPSNLTAAVSLNSAHLTWTPGQNNTGEWVVEYGLQGFNSGDGVVMTVNTTQLTISDLEWDMDYDVYVRANCAAGAMSNWSNKATFTTPLDVSIADVNAADMSIYPNPASGNTSISLSGVSGNVRVTIVDMNGRTVRSEEMSCDGTCVKVMNVEGLASGAYFVRVMGDNLNTVKKLIVK